MTRVRGNESCRTLTAVDARDAGHSNVGLHAQPIRPDDFDSSHYSDRQNNAEDRPALDLDPRIHM